MRGTRVRKLRAEYQDLLERTGKKPPVNQPWLFWRRMKKMWRRRHEIS